MAEFAGLRRGRTPNGYPDGSQRRAPDAVRCDREARRARPRVHTVTRPRRQRPPGGPGLVQHCGSSLRGSPGPGGPICGVVHKAKARAMQAARPGLDFWY